MRTFNSRNRDLRVYACGLCLLWGVSIVSMAQEIERTASNVPLNMESVNPIELFNQANPPNSRLAKQRNYRNCLQANRLAAQNSKRTVDPKSACQQEIEALRQLLPQDLHAEAAAIERDNAARTAAQRTVVAEAAALDRANAISESDFPPGYKTEKRHLRELAACRAEAAETKAFQESQCPERLRLDEEEMEAIDRYLATRLADSNLH